MFTITNFLCNIFVVFIFLHTVQCLPDNSSYTSLAREGQFPFAIRLYSNSGSNKITYCTAAIITYSKLITAGHCCDFKAERYVVGGHPDQTDFASAKNRSRYNVYKVKKVILHPDFLHTKLKIIHDLCLLILEKPISPLEGRTIRVSYEALKDNKTCTALGWGTTEGYQVQHKLYFKKATGYKCDIRFENSQKYGFVCLEPHAVCPGDSGGPLVCDGKLYGVASFFIGPEKAVTSPKCEEGVIDYYWALSLEKEFIEKNASPQLLPPLYYFFLIILWFFCK